MTIAKSSKRHNRSYKNSRDRRALPRDGHGVLSGKPQVSDAMTCAQTLSSGQLCGKKCYRSRKEAKAAAAILYPGQRMRFYTCAGYHHMTSSDAVKSEQTRREIAAGRGVFNPADRQRPAVWPGQPREEA